MNKNILPSVYWITGLSGAGKTTLSKLFYNLLKSKNLPVILLDGDDLREIFGRASNSVDNHNREARMELAMKYSRLCKLLSSQGFIVIIATISLFHEVHTWNRSNIPKYFEVYLKVPFEELRKRDTKEIYKRFDKGEIKFVAGLDLTIDEPNNADWVIDFESTSSPNSLAEELLIRSTL